MSRKLQPKDKDIVNLQVVKSSDVWVKNKKGKFILDSNYDYYGKIDKGMSSFVTMTNKQGLNSKFIEDTCKLTKKTKNEIVKALSSKKTRVFYLVKKK